MKQELIFTWITFILLCTTISHAYLDSLLINKGKVINHKKELLIYSIINLILLIVFMTITHSHTLINWIYTIFIGAFTRGGLFDYSLNIFRGKPLNYTSSTSEGDSIYKSLTFSEDLKVTRFFLFCGWCMNIIYLILETV